LQEDIWKNLDNIPDENFIIFAQPSPDKRKKFYKDLIKKITVKEYISME